MALMQLETYNPSLNYDQQVSLNNAVTAVANWCMFQGGPGVLEARAWLLRNQLNQDFLQWEDSCYTSPPQRIGRFENEEENLVENQLQATSLIDNKKYYLHPNPTKTGFGATIELAQDAEGRVELYTIDGKQIGNYRVKTGSNLIELKDLGSGIYFYRVWINNNLNNTSKLVILE
jgi:hypothetical protein